MGSRRRTRRPRGDRQLTPEQFDLIAIGSGSAGREAARLATLEHGARVAVIESTRLGGSCPNVACKPAKVYLLAGELMHDVNRLAATLGIVVGEARADLARIKARKDAIVGTRQFWLDLLVGRGYELVEGRATFVDSRSVRVGDRLLRAERILVATGSLSTVPPIEGLDAVDALDHVSALELTELPESLLVLGAGAVGLEFAQAFARFGSRVTLVEADQRITPRSDHDASAALETSLREEMEILTRTRVEHFRPDGAETVATLTGGREIRAARLLLAVGRVPNIAGLGLDVAGVATTAAGVTVDERMRTNVPGVWAAGDVVAIAQYTPAAQHEARVAVADMFGVEGASAADHANLPTAIFTDPELASVGLAEHEAVAAGHDVGTASVASVLRLKFTDAANGLFKIVFDRGTRRVLGVHVVSRGGSDVVHGLAVAMNLGATVEDLARTHNAFPTHAEGVRDAAELVAAAVS